MTGYDPSAEVAEIRAQIDHTIIDGDGHIIEYLPLARDILVEIGGSSVAERFDVVVDRGRLMQKLSPQQRRELALTTRGTPPRGAGDPAPVPRPR